MNCNRADLEWIYSQLRLIEPPVNRFHRLIGSKQPGPEVTLLSGVDCTYLLWN